MTTSSDSERANTDDETTGVSATETTNSAPETTSSSTETTCSVPSTSSSASKTNSAQMTNSAPDTTNSPTEMTIARNTACEAGERIDDSPKDLDGLSGHQSVEIASPKLRRLRLAVLLHQDLGAIPLSFLMITRIVALRCVSRRFVDITHRALRLIESVRLDDYNDPWPREQHRLHVLTTLAQFGSGLKFVNFGLHNDLASRSMIAQIVSRCDKIHTIERLESRMITSLAFPPESSTRTFPSVTRLHIAGTTDNRPFLDSVAAHFPKLKSLDLMCILSSSVVHRAEPVLTRCVHLQSIRFQFFQFQNDDLRNFRHLIVLRALWFFNGALDDEQCQILSQVLAPSLIELKLSGSRVGVAGVLCFAKSHPDLEHLSILTTGIRLYATRDNAAGHIFGWERSEVANFPKLKTICVPSPDELLFNEILNHVGRRDVIVNGNESPFAPMRGFRDSWGA